MNVRTAALFVLAVALFAGCSSTPPQKQEPVSVSGVVLLPGGQPAQDVTITFYPTSSDQIQGGGAVKDGKFQATLTPGKYTFVIEGTGQKNVPAKYHSNDAANSVEIPSGGTSDLKIQLTK